MTFTLVSHLREQLSKLVRSKADELERAEKEKERIALEDCRFLLSSNICILKSCF